MKTIQYIASDYDHLSALAKLLRWVRLTLEGMVQGLGVGDSKDSQIPDSQTGPQKIKLSNQDCFVATLDLPRAPWESHQKAIGLNLEEISPIDPDKAVFAARAIAHPDEKTIRYSVAICDGDQLAMLEDQARQSGASQVSFHPQGAEALVFKSAKTSSQRQNDLVKRVAIIGVVFIALLVGSWTMTSHLENSRLELLSSDRSQRIELGQERRRREALGALNTNIETYILGGRAGVLTKDLETVTAALPEGLSITELNWSAGQIEMILSGDISLALEIEWPEPWVVRTTPAGEDLPQINTIALVRAVP
jgi:hypothetical protein